VRLAEEIPDGITVIRLMPRKKDWNEVVCDKGECVKKEMEFFHLMEKFFENKELLECIAIMVAGRQEQEEEEQRLLEKAEANMKAGGGS
jgi:hypothetical protein